MTISILTLEKVKVEEVQLSAEFLNHQLKAETNFALLVARNEN